MQFTLTIDRLAESRAAELAAFLEEQDEAPLAVTLNETDEAAKLWNVVAYFADEGEARAAARTIEPLLKDEAIAIDALPDVDWVRRSLEGLAPVIAGRFFLYGSHDRERRRAGGISLEIDAGTAFGTGHHGTTSGCLLALDRLLKRTAPRRVLDVGCGTGVLAIAAARALRRAVTASDIDPIAVDVTLANARNNDAAGFVAGITAPGLKHQRIAGAAPYDLIFANILARPLIALAGDLSASLAPGGTLILSGLTLDQEQAVRAAYRNRGLIPEPPIRLGNWATLVFRQAGSRKVADFSGRILRLKSKSPRRFRHGHHMGTAAGGGWELA